MDRNCSDPVGAIGPSITLGHNGRQVTASTVQNDGSVIRWVAGSSPARSTSEHAPPLRHWSDGRAGRDLSDHQVPRMHFTLLIDAAPIEGFGLDPVPDGFFIVGL